MKITMPKDWKDYFTVTEAEQARAYIAFMKEDTATAAEMIRTVAAYVDGVKWPEVITAAPITATKDSRVPYDPETGYTTGHLSGWIKYDTEDGREHVAEITTTIYDYWNVGPDNFRPRTYMTVYTR